jgi:hypothetical protein
MPSATLLLALGPRADVTKELEYGTLTKGNVKYN